VAAIPLPIKDVCQAGTRTHFAAIATPDAMRSKVIKTLMVKCVWFTFERGEAYAVRTHQKLVRKSKPPPRAMAMPSDPFTLKA
jgi:hypothetical protein